MWIKIKDGDSDDEDGAMYVPFSMKSVDTIPAGVYEPVRTNIGFAFKEITIQRDDDIILFNSRKMVMDEIMVFNNAHNDYVEMHVPHKRGYLLYGPPGTGKTALIREIIRNLPDAICVDVSENILSVKEVYKTIRKINESLIVFLMEDIDSIASDETLTQTLDGTCGMYKVLFVGTTNNIGGVSDRLKRPGRFDRKILIDNLNDTERREYISSLLKLADKRTINRLVKETKDFSIAAIKNHVIEHAILGKKGGYLREVASHDKMYQ